MSKKEKVSVDLSFLDDIEDEPQNASTRNGRSNGRAPKTPVQDSEPVIEQRAAQTQRPVQQVVQQQPVQQQQVIQQQPMVQQPVYQQPMYQQPMYQQPMYQQPMQQMQPVQEPVAKTEVEGGMSRVTSMIEKENVIRLILEHWKTDQDEVGRNTNLGPVSDKESIIKAIIDKWRV